jgi:NAD-specific glutamate dehydrogenase
MLEAEGMAWFVCTLAIWAIVELTSWVTRMRVEASVRQECARVHKRCSDLEEKLWVVERQAAAQEAALELSDAGQTEDLAARIALMDQMRSVTRSILLDAEDEDFKYVWTTSSVLERIWYGPGNRGVS